MLLFFALYKFIIYYNQIEETISYLMLYLITLRQCMSTVMYKNHRNRLRRNYAFACDSIKRRKYSKRGKDDEVLFRYDHENKMNTELRRVFVDS